MSPHPTASPRQGEGRCVDCPKPCTALGIPAPLSVGLISTRARSKELALGSVASATTTPALSSMDARRWEERTASAQSPCPLLPPSPGTSGFSKAGSTQFCITLSLSPALAVLLGRRRDALGTGLHAGDRCIPDTCLSRDGVSWCHQPRHRVPVPLGAPQAPGADMTPEWGEAERGPYPKGALGNQDPNPGATAAVVPG